MRFEPCHYIALALIPPKLLPAITPLAVLRVASVPPGRWAAIGAFAGPVGINFGSVSGTILCCLTGGVGGCALDAQLRESFDHHALIHNLCLHCGRFNLLTAQEPSLARWGKKWSKKLKEGKPLAHKKTSHR